jgi:hypothetical protein
VGRTWHGGLLFQSEDYGQVGGLAGPFFSVTQTEAVPLFAVLKDEGSFSSFKR